MSLQIICILEGIALGGGWGGFALNNSSLIEQGILRRSTPGKWLKNNL